MTERPVEIKLDINGEKPAFTVGAWIPTGEKGLYAIYADPTQGVCIGHYTNPKTDTACTHAFSVAPDGSINIQAVVEGELKIKTICPKKAGKLFEHFFAAVQHLTEHLG